jgi:hypothetical protein
VRGCDWGRRVGREVYGVVRVMGVLHFWILKMGWIRVLEPGMME